MNRNEAAFYQAKKAITIDAKTTRLPQHSDLQRQHNSTSRSSKVTSSPTSPASTASKASLAYDYDTMFQCQDYSEPTASTIQKHAEKVNHVLWQIDQEYLSNMKIMGAIDEEGGDDADDSRCDVESSFTDAARKRTTSGTTSYRIPSEERQMSSSLDLSGITSPFYESFEEQDETDGAPTTKLRLALVCCEASAAIENSLRSCISLMTGNFPIDDDCSV